MDYDLNQANRTIADVSGGLERLQAGDVTTYNRLSAKLNKAAKHLEATQSKSHPDFALAAQRWGALQSQMAAIAQSWQEAVEAQAQTQAQESRAAETPKPAAAIPSETPMPAATTRPVEQVAQVEPVDLDPLMEKYQRNNLPNLAKDATAEQARAWAMHMQSLQTVQLEADIATIQSALRSGAASKADADRVQRWISDSFQRTIKENINQQVQQRDGAITSMIYVADLINAVEPGNKSGAYRVAGGIHGPNNQMRLDAAIQAGAVAGVFDDVFGSSDPERAANLNKIQSARQKLDELAPLAAAQAEALANAPSTQQSQTKNFLAPLAQKFWLDGDVAAESDAEGGIWIEANEVGDITHNGKIWVGSNERGSIEPNGKVWFDGNQVGSLEPNGEVWRGGDQIGLIDQEGTAWINGNPAGEVVPFQGEWKRAAILYYFRDFFAQ